MRSLQDQTFQSIAAGNLTYVQLCGCHKHYGGSRRWKYSTQRIGAVKTIELQTTQILDSEAS